MDEITRASKRRKGGSIALEEIIYLDNRWILKAEKSSKNPQNIIPSPISKPLVYRAYDYNFDSEYLHRLMKTFLYNNPEMAGANAYAYNKVAISPTEISIAIQLYRI